MFVCLLVLGLLGLLILGLGELTLRFLILMVLRLSVFIRVIKPMMIANVSFPLSFLPTIRFTKSLVVCVNLLIYLVGKRFGGKRFCMKNGWVPI